MSLKFQILSCKTLAFDENEHLASLAYNYEFISKSHYISYKNNQHKL